MTVTPAASPALSGQKYGILVSDNISVDGLAQAMSQLIKDYDENIGAWETFATTSANQSITVTINGSPVTIPSIGKLALKGSNGALGIADGGTGATTKEDARTNLGLGSSATRDAYSASGKILSEGDFGVGGITGTQINSLAEGNATSLKTGFYCGNGDNFAAPGGIGNGQYVGVIAVGMASDQYKAQIATSYGGGGRIFYRRSMAGIYQPWSEFYTTSNTTKASDGSLKAASPVARIVTSREVCQRTDIAEDGFAWCGSGTANAEAEGVNISRLDVGVYVLTGSAGLASEGWQLLPPMDPGGMGELGVVESEQTGSGGLTIRLYKRKYILSDEGEIIKTKGEPMDVPVNSWIDVRLDMPENSAWNQRQKQSSEVALYELAP